MTALIRVLVLDDEKSVRNHLRLLLSTASDIRLVGELATLRQLSPACLELKPHVLVIGGGDDTICF
ncbi:MAG: hypothetical protein U0350_27695 [Caldilineaceae bacterium]